MRRHEIRPIHRVAVATIFMEALEPEALIQDPKVLLN